MLAPDSPKNLWKVACSKIEENMLDYEGNLVKKKYNQRMISEIGSSERMEREGVEINLW